MPEGRGIRGEEIDDRSSLDKGRFRPAGHVLVAGLRPGKRQGHARLVEKDGQNEPGSDKPAWLYWFEVSRDPEGKIAFTPREIDDQSGIGTQFVVADLNGNGLLDIVTANKKGVFLFEQVRPAK
jgi:hypothetical protein